MANRSVMASQIIIVVDATGEFGDDLERAIEHLNAEQGELVFQMIEPTAEMARLANATTVTTTDVWKLLAAEHPQRLHPVIVFVNRPLSSERLTNLFGSVNDEYQFAAVTTHDHKKFSGSTIAYCCYYLCKYSINFLVPHLRNHRDTRSCLFDKKIYKPDLRLSLRLARLCGRCLPQVRRAIDSAGFHAIHTMARVVREEESRSLSTRGPWRLRRRIGNILEPSDFAEIELKYRGLAGIKALILGLLTIGPLFVASRIHALTLNISPATFVYLAYHGPSLYCWFLLANTSRQGRPRDAKNAALSSIGKIDRLPRLLSPLVYCLIALTVLCKITVVFMGYHRLGVPQIVSQFLGVPDKPLP
jgi:hypothetical protein